jgi:thioredoxin reductase (NADPH)
MAVETPVDHRRIIIVGSGPAGYTAAIYAARAGHKPLIITGGAPGGQMTMTGDVENYPGFAEPIQGTKLVDDMQAQAEACGAEIEYDIITDIDVEARPFRLTGEISQWTADAVIIATGATARWLGVPGEVEFRGHGGVSACATCDGPFYKDKTVAVVGGGNTAVEEAIHLAGLCKEVHLIHRRDNLTAEKVLIERISRLPNVIYHWSSQINSIGSESENRSSVDHVIIAGVVATWVKKLPVDGVFIAIGHDPATAVFKGKIDLDSAGYVKVAPGRTQTNIPGIFAAGDVADPHYRQAVTAAGMGCMAALDAERHLGELC